MTLLSLHLLALTLCFALTLEAPLPPAPQGLRHHIVSEETGLYVSITRSGRVNANAHIDRDAAQLLIYREANSNAIKIASFKFSRNGWFLFLTKEGKFRGGVPSNGSEVFEEVVLNPIANIVALRVRNYARIVHLESSDSSNSAPVMPGRNGPECYLGFSDKTKRAYCYSNKDSANVRLQILPKLI